MVRLWHRDAVERPFPFPSNSEPRSSTFEPGRRPLFHEWADVVDPDEDFQCFLLSSQLVEGPFTESSELFDVVYEVTFNNPFPLPFPKCALQFSDPCGVPLMLNLSQSEERSESIDLELFARITVDEFDDVPWTLAGVWSLDGKEDGSRFRNILYSLVGDSPEFDEWADHSFRDIVDSVLLELGAIALLKEIGRATLVDVPPAPKLNKSRRRSGKLPLRSYHTLKIEPDRPRQEPESDADPRRPPRFHYRRGHFVRRSSTSFWRKWTVVGDLALGQIDKHYRTAVAS